MSALDFSHFKKTAQDKHSATLMHPDGHEIKIAIAHLTPVLKKKLEALPLHQAGGSNDGPIRAMDDESPAVVEESKITPKEAEKDATLEPPAQTTPAPAPEVAAVPAPQTAPSMPAAQSVAPAPAPASAQPAPAEQPPEPMTITAQPPTPEQEAADHTKENMLMGQDLSLGHIKPQTYRDLFNKKDTLGKVGTLFGLLLSGAGSGLTHQPNALLHMMDQQIANDLEAQKNDQSNKQNWYKLSFEHTRNQALNALTNSEAYLHASEADKQHMINQTMGVIDSQASTNALNTTRMVALQEQQNNINKMPPGQQRDQAQNVLNGLVAANAKQMYQDNLNVALKKRDAMSAPKPVGEQKKVAQTKTEKTPEATIEHGPIDQKAYQDMVTKGKLFSASGYVDPNKGIDPADNAALEKAITNSNVNWKNYKDAMDVANILAKMPSAGQTPVGVFNEAIKKLPWLGESTAGLINMVQGSAERPRELLIKSLAQRLTANGASDKTIAEVSNALTPNMFDNAKTMKILENTMHQHFAHNDKEQDAMFTKYPKIKKEMPKLGLDTSALEQKKAPTEKENKEGGFFNTLKQMYTPPER